MKAKGKAAKEYRLQLIVKLREQGHNQTQIAKLVGLSQSRVSEVLIRYKKQGPKALKIKSPPGLKAGLASEQLDLLKQILEQEAKASGFATDGWTLARVGLVIQKHFGFKYSLEHVRRILKKIGFTRQRPRAKDYRQDEQAVQQWQSKRLPALKKSKTRRV